MILTRTDTLATLDLPDDLHWQDEPWSLVVQRTEWSLTGALIVDPLQVPVLRFWEL